MLFTLNGRCIKKGPRSSFLRLDYKRHSAHCRSDANIKIRSGNCYISNERQFKRLFFMNIKVAVQEIESLSLPALSLDVFKKINNYLSTEESLHNILSKE